MDIKNQIENASTSLGIELGSTRIKAVLLTDDGQLAAQGNFDWENSYENGVWTYPLEKAVLGIQTAYANLKKDVAEKYGINLTKIGAIGISAMMHGYIVLDKDNKQLAPFRTWRNAITGVAADRLTKLLDFNIPQRWSIAHLEHSIINGEEHVKDIAFMTTLAGYIHFLLTGEKVLGVDDASGMFPIDSETLDFDKEKLEKFNGLHAADGYSWKLAEILPKVLSAGDKAGTLTAAGANLLDPSGELESGAPCCPPEGDAATGMVATNSVEYRTGNVSAGTSIFAMAVLEKPLSKMYTEIDMVTTPDGKPVAMVHCNNCTGDIDAWVRVFSEVLSAFGADVKKGALYDKFYEMALAGDKDCGGVVSYNFFSGEPVINVPDGRPMTVRTPDAKLNFANLARSLVFSSFATLQMGMDILVKEQVKLDRMLGHGGLFKTEFVGQSLISSALGIPVAVMPTAAEGGAWGIAILAQFMKLKAEGQTLPSYLDEKVFGDVKTSVVQPNDEDAKGFSKYIARYAAGLGAHTGAAKIN